MNSVEPFAVSMHEPAVGTGSGVVRSRPASFGAKFLAGSIAATCQVGTFRSRLWHENENACLGATTYFVNDSVPMPGEVVSEAAIERKKRMATAVSLLGDFALNGYSWNGEDLFKITPATAVAAEALLARLEPNFGLPKIAPNSEGNLVMLWNKAVDPVLVVVDDWKLHLVKSATTPRATYRDNIPFDGEDVPKEVVSALH